jgi:DNA-binding transcriptional LysR family regulator
MHCFSGIDAFGACIVLDLKLLKSLVVIADEGNLGRAASRLHISQPALTRRMKELERVIQFPLFERFGRGIRLSGEARGFLVQCRDLLAHAESVKERAQSVARGASGTLRAGATPQMLERLFPDLLERYHGEFPLVEVDLVERTSRDLSRLLESGEVDVAVIPAPHGDRFESRDLPPLLVLAAMASASPLGGMGQVEILDIADAPVLLLHDGYMTRQVFDSACKLAQVQPHIVLESGAPQTILALAAKRLGIAVVPSTVLIDRLELQVAQVTHSGTPLAMRASVCWNRGRHMAPYAVRFVETLIETAKEKLVSPLAAGGLSHEGEAASIILPRTPETMDQ